MIENRLTEWKIIGNDIEINANVPGDVVNDLYNCGIIDDPNYAKNLQKISWVFASDWIYRCRFDVDDDLFDKKRIYLYFEGIDTLSEIRLNGVELGTTDNMFLAYRFDVKKLLRRRGNELTVTIHSSSDYIRKQNDGKNYRTLFNKDRIFLRKAQCHFGWDWAPDMPGIGIWLPVWLNADDGERIDDVWISAQNDGNVAVTVTLDGDARGCSLCLEIDNKEIFAEVTDNAVTLNALVESPRLWWPNGYGEPNLYEYRLTLFKNGEECDRKTGTFGFKQVRLLQDRLPNGRIGFCIEVNGVRIFVKGSNWVPCSSMTGAIEDSTYQKLLGFAHDANFNMLRIWGGGIYEKEIFFDLCDRLGILTWQEFGNSCSVIPAEIGEEMQNNMLEEAKYQIRRLRNHASLCIWCGGNEFMPFRKVPDYYEYSVGNQFVKETLRDLCKELDPEKIYLYNSPCTVETDEWDDESGDSHVGSMSEIIRSADYAGFRKIIASRPVQFLSENANLGSCRLKSLKKFIPHDELWPTSDTWDFHYLLLENDSGCENFVETEKALAKGFFGGFDGVEDFVKKSMIAHAEILVAEIDFARSNKACNGYMNWMYNDIWPCGTWSVVDSYFERKPAYYAMKRGFLPVRVVYVQTSEQDKVCLINDTAKTLCGKLMCEGKFLSGKVNAAIYSEVTCLPYSTTEIIPAEDLGGDYLSMRFVSDDGEKVSSTAFPHTWKDKRFRTEIEWRVDKISQTLCVVELDAKTYGRTVFIDHPQSENLRFEDNFFDMESGEKRIIRISADKSFNMDLFSVKTFADTWDELISLSEQSAEKSPA